METNNLPALNTNNTPLCASDVKAQINLIQDVMRSVMKENEHYGKIPGCGNKLVLLKAGAEKLALTFRLCPSYEVKRTDYQGNHREYEVICTIRNLNGQTLAQGVGCCSTLESKYKYRKSVIDTRVFVPKSYWDDRREESLKIALGGAFPIPPTAKLGTQKVDGKWLISIHNKEENQDIADTYNTVLKMAKKRAQVDATITATSCSDIFTQDLEESVEPETIEVKTKEKPKEETQKENHYEPEAGTFHYKLPYKKEGADMGAIRKLIAKEFGDSAHYNRDTYMWTVPVQLKDKLGDIEFPFQEYECNEDGERFSKDNKQPPTKSINQIMEEDNIPF